MDIAWIADWEGVATWVFLAVAGAWIVAPPLAALWLTKATRGSKEDGE